MKAKSVRGPLTPPTKDIVSRQGASRAKLGTQLPEVRHFGQVESIYTTLSSWQLLRNI